MQYDDPFSSADLPIVDGRVYHLDLKPDELARDIILVGDPERVPFLAAEFLAEKEVDRSHRGFRSITGRIGETGERVSIITSGIGVPSIEIVLNEIVALNEIDFRTRRRKLLWEPLTVIRLGTCGGLQPDTALGTLIVTDYVIGLDNTGLFYDASPPDQCCQKLEERVREVLADAVEEGARFRGKIFPYAARAHPEVRVALEREALHLGTRCKRGVTVSSSGFFANEGRRVSRIEPTAPEISSLLAAMDTGIPGVKVENMEMEASFLLHFMGGLGYRAGAICAVIDKRDDGSFMANYLDAIREAAQVTLRALSARHREQEQAYNP